MQAVNKLEQILCPICLKTLEHQQEFRYIETFKLENSNFHLFECPMCLVKFWHPFKNPGPEWYKNCKQNLMHRDFHDKEYFLWLAEHRGITKHFLENPPHKNPKDLLLLDVACGTGGFLLEARKFGYKVLGVDFDSEQVKVARSFGLEDVHADDVIHFLSQHQGTFDVITGFEIIEHVDQPREFLKAIYNALKPGGFLCLSTPNSLRIGPRNEFWDFPYHHLTRWTKKSLGNIVRLENFKSIKVKEELPISFLVSKFRVGFGVRIRKLLQSKNEKTKKIVAFKKNEYKDTVAKLGSVKDRVLYCALLPIAYLLFLMGKKGQGLYLTAEK